MFLYIKSSVVELVATFVFRPLNLTFKTASALTLIPKERIIIVTCALVHNSIMFSHEPTLYEQIIIPVFVVLVDDMSENIVEKYEGEVKDFVEKIKGIVFMPVRLLAALSHGIHRTASPIVDQCVYYIKTFALALFVQEESGPHKTLSAYILDAMFFLLSIIESMIESFTYNPITAIMDWAWPEHNPNYIIGYYVDKIIQAIREYLLMVAYSWKASSISYCLAYLFCSAIDLIWKGKRVRMQQYSRR